MTWRFEPGEPLSDAFRRVAGEEVARIRSGLADDIDHAKAVHQARQGFKRLRALTRLGKPALGSAFDEENRRWRDAGRLLAGSRDNTVLLQSFDRFAQQLRVPDAGNEAAFLLGYDDPNSFYRAFKTWEGTTPAQWRSGRSHAMFAG